MAIGSDLTSTSFPEESFGIWSWLLKICWDAADDVIVTYLVRFGETYIRGSCWRMEEAGLEELIHIFVSEKLELWNKNARNVDIYHKG